MLEFEHQAWLSGYSRVAGVDEAGRGPLAGPVMAAAVVFNREFLESEQRGCLAGLDDSKKLTESKRNLFFRVLAESSQVEVGVGSASVAEIDETDILRATHLAMRRALVHLSPLPDLALVDGLPVPGLPCESTAIVRGDSKSLSISAASIVAKVTRDELMRELDKQYSVYGFARHKGYGTREHMRTLLEHGPCSIHRRSFQPVRDAEQIAKRESERRQTSRG